ncbi:MAG: hypothetical protein ACYDAQ_00010 [Mycobacteriales bacterium]
MARDTWNHMARRARACGRRLVPSHIECALLIVVETATAVLHLPLLVYLAVALAAHTLLLVRHRRA